MNNNFAKILSSFAMVGVLACTGVAAQAAEAVSTECADTLSIGGCAANIKRIYTANYPEEADMINEIVDTLSSSDEFIAIFNDEGATAFQIIEDSLRDALVPTASVQTVSKGVYSSRYTVPAIYQRTNYYCGPASVLQALIGNGVLSDVYSVSRSELGSNNIRNQNSVSKQNEIAGAMGTTAANGTYIGSISAYMRNHFPAKNGYEYKAKAFTRYTYGNAIELVKASLAQNAVPIIRVPDTSVLYYYHGTSQSHYVCVSKVDTENNEVTLVDPNCTGGTDDPRYMGTWTVPMSEFENIVNYDGWIAVYTKAADGYYVYE